MTNNVTNDELVAAADALHKMTPDDVALLTESIGEQAFEIRAAFGTDCSLADAVVEGTGEPVGRMLYEIIYKARVAKLFEERDYVER